MRLWSIFLLLACFALADTVTFRDGRVVTGSYLGGDGRSIRVAIADRVETYSVDDVAAISFDRVRAAENREAEKQEEAKAAEAPQLPVGTVLTVRMIESVDSMRDRTGQTFRATLDDPLLDPNGNRLIPRGAAVVVKLVDDQQSGKIEGRTVLTLDLVSIDVNGRTVEVNTQTVTEQSASRTVRSGKVIGGSTLFGAIIGALAGGGKGAAVGAGAGAGAGTAVELSTKGQRVFIPSETRLTFKLQQPVLL